MFWRKLSIAALFLAVTFSTTSPEGALSEITLKRTGPDASAIGTATVRREQNVGCESELRITLHRLRPGVYSVWLLDKRTGGRNPAGFKGENHFRTSGSASYSLYTSETNLNRRELEIAFHPDGDPENVEDMVVVLTAKIIM